MFDDTIMERLTIQIKRPIIETLKEEVTAYGVQKAGMSGLIAIIIGGKIPDETMNVILAKNIRELAEMTDEELINLPGIGKASATRFAAAFELARRMNTTMPEERPSIKSPENAAALVMAEMRHFDREHFWALLLNSKNQVLAREVVSIGTLNFSAIHPRELFKAAIKRSAAGVILVHNHPSGDPTPSRQDIEATGRLVEAGNIVGIEVLDHLVIGDNSFTSFKAQGLM